MHVLVIGGAGYIGSHVVKELLNRGDQVTVFDDLSTGHKENLFKKATFIQGDMMDKDALAKAFSTKPDSVILLAGKKNVGESMEIPEIYADNNITGVLNVLNAMVKYGVKDIVFSSSSSVYGIPSYVPTDEKHSLNPISFYGFTKLETERFLEWYHRLKGINFVALRYFNAVGYDNDGDITGIDRNPQNLLPIIMEVLIGKRDKLKVFGNDYDTKDGTCIRDYIHVTDLGTAHALSLDYLAKGGKSICMNLGTEKGVSILEMINGVEKVTGRKVAYEFASRRAGDPPATAASGKLARDLLQWKPEYSSLDNIIETTWQVYQNLK